MEHKLLFFTSEQGSVLLRLLIAHLLSDFVLQTNRMVHNKKWFSKEMFQHCAIVYVLSALFTGYCILSLILAIAHYVIDGIKIELQKRNQGKQFVFFVVDQLLHVIVIIGIWGYHFGIAQSIEEAFVGYFTNYQVCLLIFGYLLVTYPMGFLIKKILTATIPSDGTEPTSSQEKGGTYIGIFERVIILTLVLLVQYEAIGFLITGKSIIRFANKDEHLKSEYVLLGTMISYCLAILVGVILNWLG